MKEDHAKVENIETIPIKNYKTFVFHESKKKGNCQRRERKVKGKIKMKRRSKKKKKKRKETKRRRK